ncbi:hypothetical protein RND71_005537 [Anisodus tanguticus]|uniref:Uncharacterized protein n=1 Tax=Anisodus tanguticus TaxID=243964 RepID=A0AAE1VVK3_9SOLA|nr:hypothetical protein RND71_005537 [Anisodus tanguticus]
MRDAHLQYPDHMVKKEFDDDENCRGLLGYFAWNVAGDQNWVLSLAGSPKGEGQGRGLLGYFAWNVAGDQNWQPQPQPQPQPHVNDFMILLNDMMRYV